MSMIRKYHNHKLQTTAGKPVSNQYTGFKKNMHDLYIFVNVFFMAKLKNTAIKILTTGRRLRQSGEFSLIKYNI